MIEIKNPFKKQNVNGYETYSPDSALKVFFKSLNPLAYSDMADKHFWNLFKGFLLAILIASLIFILILIPKINSMDFSEPLGAFDTLNISIDNEMNSALELPENRPYLIVDTRGGDLDQNETKTESMDEYNMTLFETNKTEESIANVKEEVKEKVDKINSRIFIDNDRLLINTLIVKKEILFEDYKDVVGNQENYKNIFVILAIALIPSIILLFYLYLFFKFAFIILGVVMIALIICLISKFKIKFISLLKLGLLASIPAMVFEAFALTLFFNVWQVYYFIYPTFIIYFVFGIIKKGYKEKDGIF